MLTPLELAQKRTYKVMARRAKLKAKRRNWQSLEVGRSRARIRVQALASEQDRAKQREAAIQQEMAKRARLSKSKPLPKPGLLARVGRFFGRGS